MRKTNIENAKDYNRDDIDVYCSGPPLLHGLTAIPPRQQVHHHHHHHHCRHHHHHHHKHIISRTGDVIKHMFKMSGF